MTVIISVILNFIKNKLFELAKSKYFLLALIAIITAVYILFLNMQLNNKNKKINNLNNEIISLESKNSVLYKDLVFKQTQIHIKQIFTNSDEVIEKIAREDEIKLSDEYIKALKTIIYDYNKAMEIK
ncbi:hypothetical protein [Brachyspira alvinipulli]|uniref:hypothetical protein n=1 Tax=Brachyspira alvinipulli TaxID=84379 RepID=UPI0004AE21B5|nr:hypothetical protein [Brachyspira alvinipulli]